MREREGERRKNTEGKKIGVVKGGKKTASRRVSERVSVINEKSLTVLVKAAYTLLGFQNRAAEEGRGFSWVSKYDE